MTPLLQVHRVNARIVACYEALLCVLIVNIHRLAVEDMLDIEIKALGIVVLAYNDRISHKEGIEAVTAESSGQKSTKPNSRKRKSRPETYNLDSTIKAQKSPAVPETREHAYGTRTRRKSVG